MSIIGGASLIKGSAVITADSGGAMISLEARRNKNRICEASGNRNRKGHRGGESGASRILISSRRTKKAASSSVSIDDLTIIVTGPLNSNRPPENLKLVY